MKYAPIRIRDTIAYASLLVAPADAHREAFVFRSRARLACFAPIARCRKYRAFALPNKTVCLPRAIKLFLELL